MSKATDEITTTITELARVAREFDVTTQKYELDTCATAINELSQALLNMQQHEQQRTLFRECGDDVQQHEHDAIRQLDMTSRHMVNVPPPPDSQHRVLVLHDDETLSWELVADFACLNGSREGQR